MMTVPSENYGGNIDYSSKYLTFEALESGIFQCTNDINYSLDDGTTWVALSANTPTPLINPGQKICWSKTAPTTTDASYRTGTFSSSGRFNIEGNVMSLAYGTNFIGKTSLQNKLSIFCQLFAECNKLIYANKLVLPATTISQNCYGHMFQGCGSMIEGPEILPAMVLDVDCYQQMFRRCPSLVRAPQLPATTLDAGCYQFMFGGCSSLSSAPALPATELQPKCYYSMFSNCTSLTRSPDLPATQLVIQCYYAMFFHCSNLNYIKCLAAGIITSNETDIWTNGVASSGTFYRNQTMSSSWPVGDNGIPDNWTVI